MYRHVCMCVYIHIYLYIMMCNIHMYSHQHKHILLDTHNKHNNTNHSKYSIYIKLFNSLYLTTYFSALTRGCCCRAPPRRRSRRAGRCGRVHRPPPHTII